MPKRKDPNDERERAERGERAEHPQHEHEHDHGRNDEHEGPGDRDQPRRRRMGREHAVHEQIVERRLGGGAPATPVAYAKALEEWHQLPGVVMRPPTDEKPATKATAEHTDEEDKENPA
jgi:hypothetical protein